MTFIALISFLLLTWLSLTSNGLAEESILELLQFHTKVPTLSAPKYHVHKTHSYCANDYIDNVFRKVKKYVDEYELNEIPLPYVHFQFGTKDISDVIFHNGSVSGFETIHRMGDVNVTTRRDDLYIDVTSVTNLTVFSSVVIYKKNGLINQSAFNATLSATEHCTLRVRELKNITLDYFQVKNSVEILTEIMGLLPCPVQSYITNELLKVLRNVTSYLDGEFPDIIQKSIDSYPFDHLIPDL